MRSIVPRSLGPWLAVLTLVLAGTAAAVGYGLTAPKRYRATAQLLVSPVSVNDPTFTGLDVLRDSGGKQTAVASAAALLRSPQVADVVRADLGLARSRDSLLNALDAHVVDSSDVVGVTVEDTSAAGAAQLANAFADGLVKQRTASFQSQLAATIRRTQQLLNAVPAAQRATGAGAALATRLAVLQGFQGQPDPTIRHAGQASAPAAASWPSLPRLAAIGAAAGLVAGLIVAALLIFTPLGRRGRAEEAEPYDRGVSDRLAERLEQRVAERIAALETERERLAARETALAVRERDVSAKLVELREAAGSAPDAHGPTPGQGSDAAVAAALAAREAALAEREQEVAAKLEELRAALTAVPERGGPEVATGDADALAARAAGLDARVAELTQREIALARRAAQVSQREQAAQAQTEELAAREAAQPDPARVAELTQREIALARRAVEVSKLEEQATARSEELAVRAGALEVKLEEAERVGRLVPEAEPEPVAPAALVAEPVFAASPQGAGNGERSGAWNLLVLERLVNARGADFPDKRDEWISYLFFLREYAEPDGTVPSSFDLLIQDTFAELVT